MIMKKAFKNKKVLITGHTGLKGSWLSLLLSHLGANVYGVSNNFSVDKTNYKT